MCVGSSSSADPLGAAEHRLVWRGAVGFVAVAEPGEVGIALYVSTRSRTSQPAIAPLARLAKKLITLYSPSFSSRKRGVTTRPSRRSVRTRGPVLDRRQVHDTPGRRLGEVGVQQIGDRVAPERIQVVAVVGAQRGAHLQPVRLHEVERAEQAVEARQDPYALLRVRVVALGEGGSGVQGSVDVAGERQDRRGGRCRS